jgi:hypothetical protein
MTILKTAVTTVTSKAEELFAKECNINYSANFYDKDAVRIITPTTKDQTQLYAKKYHLLERKGLEWGCSLVEIFDLETENTIHIKIEKDAQPMKLNALGTDIITSDKSLTSKFSGIKRPGLNLLRKMTEALEHDLSVSIIWITSPNNPAENQIQVFTTDGFNALLNVNSEIAVGRSMNMGWMPEHLAEVNQTATQQTKFTKKYIAGLNKNGCGEFVGEIEYIQDERSGLYYRVNKNVGFKVIDYPDSMKQLAAFDW